MPARFVLHQSRQVMTPTEIQLAVAVEINRGDWGVVPVDGQLWERTGEADA